MNPNFRAPFRRILGLDVRTGVLLLVVFGVVRVVLVLQANVTGSYQAVGAIFAVMIALPWVLLTREGRRRIGIVAPRWRWLPPALVSGLVAAGVVYVVALSFWGTSIENPFAYIALSYTAVPSPLEESQRLMFFLIFAGIGVTFSPLGEEILYRGLAHESFASRLGDRGAAFVDAGAFAVVHLAHFGIVYIAGIWTFLPLPALLWFTAMFLVSLLFFAFRRLGGSLWAAIVAHAGFNLGMNALIFFAILP